MENGNLISDHVQNCSSFLFQCNKTFHDSMIDPYLDDGFGEEENIADDVFAT